MSDKMLHELLEYGTGFVLGFFVCWLLVIYRLRGTVKTINDQMHAVKQQIDRIRALRDEEVTK